MEASRKVGVAAAVPLRGMRAVAFLFALYFAVLGCMACADEPVCADPTGLATMRAAHPVGDHSLGDWCSPLCQCHCCGGAVMPVPLGNQVAYTPPTEWATSLRHGRLVVAAPTRALGSVWQPPQA